MAAAVAVAVVVVTVAAPARAVVVGDSLLFVSAPPVAFKSRSVVSVDVGDKATGRVALEDTVAGRVAETSEDVFAETTVDDNEEEDEADEECIAAVEATVEAAEAEAAAAEAAVEREELAAVTATAAVAAGDGLTDDTPACATVEVEAEADASGVSADDVGAAAVIDAAGPQKVCAMSTLATAPDPTPSAACWDTAADLVESVGARAGVGFGVGLSAFRKDMKASSGAAALGFPAFPGAPPPGDRRLADSGLSMDAEAADVTEGAEAEVRSPPAEYAAGEAAAAPAASSPSSLRSLRET